jgi:hypothetical protein
MKQRKGDVLFAVIFGGGFLALGLVCLSWSLPDIWVGARSYTWPTVPGRIVYVRGAATKAAAGQLERPPLLYEYAVQGRRYIGGRLAFDGLRRRSARAAGHLAKHYRVGQEVTVHHNPRQARAATLKHGIGLFLMVPLLFGISGLVLSALILMGTFVRAPHERLTAKE